MNTTTITGTSTTESTLMINNGNGKKKANNSLNLTSSIKDEWKLYFIGEKSKELYLNLINQIPELISICQQQSADRIKTLQKLKQNLTLIRDRVIGNSCCKYFFMRNNLLQALLPLLWMKDETSAEFTAIINDCQKDALTLFSVLMSQNGIIQFLSLPAIEIFTNLLSLLQGSATQSASAHNKFFEILTKSLVCFTKKVEGTRDLPFTDENLSILLNLLNPHNSNPQISQNVAILLSTCCDNSLKQKNLINLGIIDLLQEIINSICYIDDLGRLTITDARLLDGTVDILCTLTRDNLEVCNAVSSISLRSRRSLPSLLYQFLNLSLISTDLKLKISLL